MQHAGTDALVRNILTEIEDTGMAAQQHSLGSVIAAHVSAERLADQDTLLQMAD